MLNTKTRPNILRYATSAFWLLSEQAARMVSTLLIGILIARHLGPEGLGQTSYAWSIVGIFSVFASLGLEGIVIKELIHNPNSRNEILGAAFYSMLIAGSIVATLLSCSVKLITSSPIEQWLIILAALTLPLQAASVVGHEKQSRASLGLVTRAQLTQVIFSTFLRAALVAFGCSVVAFGMAGLADAALLFLLLLAIAIRDKLHPNHWRFKWSIAKRLLLQSWPLIFTGLLVTIFVRIDQIMLRNLVDVKAVGEFAVAVRLTGVLVIIPMMIIKAVNPAIIAAQKDDQTLFEDRLQLLYDLGVLLSVSASLAFSLISKPLIQVLFGNDYAGSNCAAIVFVWSSIWITIGQINATTMIATGKTHQTLIKAFLGVLTNIIFNYALINKFGIEGAAIGTLISYIISAHILMLLFPSQHLHFRLVNRSLVIPMAISRIFRFANHYRSQK